MAHRLDIDHKHRSVTMAPSGRVAAVQRSMPERDRRRLGRRLSSAVTGDVRFDSGTRALYATDASNYRQVPLGVVLPRTTEDAVITMRLCAQEGACVTPRGGGTGLAGGATNVAVVIDFSRYMDKVRWLDAERRLAEVEPGCILDTLRNEAEEHGLTFGPDPATHRQNSIGGMIGNNSCGVHSVMAGRTSDNVERLDIVTADGTRMTVGPTSDEDLARILGEGGRKAEIYRALDDFRSRHAELLRTAYPDIPRRVSGYENLEQLLPEHGFNIARALVGTEATCVTVLGAELRLVPSPQERVLCLVGFADIFAAADAVPEVLEFGPIGLEGIDDLLIEFVRTKQLADKPMELLPEGDGWLMAEFGGTTGEEAAAAAQDLADRFGAKGHACKIIIDTAEQARIWGLRESALAATAHVPDMPETWPGWEDSAVPRDRLGDYLRDLKALFSAHGYRASVYGHFGDGLVHCRVPFDLRSEAGIANWQAFLEKAADLVARYGGSLSGEHGDGEARSALLDRMYSPELMEAFRQFKAIWDSDGRMNPGKVVEPFPPTANLRVGPLYAPREPEHAFAYEEDGGSFARATRRCVGVAACRQLDDGEQVMCPSYIATREEKHSTRGRAHLLFEMLHGDALSQGWRSNEVEEALDLCLACKGCKSDCPVHVDMATYKAEFRAHHYAGRLRPRAAYSMGLIHRWSQLAAKVPGLANFGTRAPGVSALVKWAAGIAQHRTMPAYAPQTFTDWFHARPDTTSTGRRVVLWPDTFNNHFRVETAKAATGLLEALGYQVVVPKSALCCGRPLYDWGRIESAKALWRRTFDALETEITAGTPIVGLEPACVSAFRDELPGLFPGDERAQHLAERTSILSEFLEREGATFRSPNAGRHALVQIHCHQHAVLDRQAEMRVLKNAGIEMEVIPSGCCGMAGGFGFEAEKYEVSQTLAERTLAPRVREAEPDTLILANGFSCREQIEQATGRKTMHLAEILAHDAETGRLGLDRRSR